LQFPSAIAVNASGSRVVLCETLEHRCQVFALDKPQAFNPVTNDWLNASLEVHRHASEPGRIPAAPTLTAAKPPGPYAGILDQGASALLVYDLAARSPFPIARTGRPGDRLGECSLPRSLAMDGSGKRYYVLDAGNQRIQVFELSTQSQQPAAGAAYLKAVGALAPLRTLGTRDSPGPERSSVDALCVDTEGNLWSLDAQNAAVLKFDSNGRRIREIRLHGGSSDGTSNLVGLAVGSGGKKIYLLDQCGCQVLAYDADGALAFSWGGREAADETCFRCPSGIAADADGFVYIVDSGLHDIKKFDALGKFVIQWGRYGSKGGEFSSPEGIWLMGRDRVIVDDAGNHRGQVFTLDGAFVAQLPKGANPSPP